MKKVYLALNNKIMKQFIINSNIFEIKEDPNESYDLVFCDTLELCENITSKCFVYLACHYFEHLDCSSLYEKFDYFIGFGKNVYTYLENDLGLSISKILDGFIYLDNENINYNDSISIYMKYSHKDNPLFNMNHKIFKEYFTLIQDSKFKLYTNFPLHEHSRKNINYNWVDDLDCNLLNSCPFIFTDDYNNCRLYFNSEIIKKSIFAGLHYSNIELICKNAKSSGFFSLFYHSNLNGAKKISESMKIKNELMHESQNKCFHKYFSSFNNQIDPAIKQELQKFNPQYHVSNFLEYIIFSPILYNNFTIPYDYFAEPTFTEKYNLKQIFDNFSEYCINKELLNTKIPNINNEFITILKEL